MNKGLKEILIKTISACEESYNIASIENEETDTQVYIKSNIISWRGTENFQDWITNLHMELTKTPYGKIHHGFWEGYKSVSNKVEGVYNSLKYIDKNKPVIITGHSLGGALALINGIDFLEKGYDVQGIYTFGQPRVFHRISAAKLKKKYYDKIFRCVHNNDIVPRVPFSSLGFGHLGKLLYFDHDLDYMEDANWAKIKLDRIVGRLEGRLEDILNKQTDGIKDHKTMYYKECMNRIMV